VKIAAYILDESDSQGPHVLLCRPCIEADRHEVSDWEDLDAVADSRCACCGEAMEDIAIKMAASELQQHIDAEEFPANGLLADGRDVVVTVPAGAECRTYHLRGPEDGSITVSGEGNGHARRSGSGGGHALRTGSGYGNAVRSGSGHGWARRSGSGHGGALRSGAGDGEAHRTGSGEGQAHK